VSKYKYTIQLHR